MKRLAMAALAAMTFAAPLVATTEAAADHRSYYERRGEDRDWNNGRNRHDRGRHRGWDRRRHNGYEYRGRWYFGPPPVAYYDDPYFYPGYREWRRGDRLPRYYLERFDVVDWRYNHLRPPPRGCRYVRDDRGDYLLVGIATGVILGVILSD